MSASDFRAAAWERLRGKWLKMALIMFLSALVTSKFGLNRLDYATRALTIDTPFRFLGENGMLSVNIPSGSAWLFKIIIFLLGVFALVIRSGCVNVSMRVIRRQKPEIADLFLRGVFWKMLWMNIVRYIIVGLFNCLLVVPGIIMSLAYSMADYLLIENPHMGPLEALRESRKRMKGYKGSFFGLCMSFIGWIVLAALAMGLITRFLPLPGMINSWISAALVSMLSAYIFTAQAAFHMYLYGENIG